MRINSFLTIAMASVLMISCQNKAQKEQSEPECHELLTVTAQDHTLNTEYPASIQGNQDIKIIPTSYPYLKFTQWDAILCKEKYLFYNI